MEREGKSAGQQVSESASRLVGESAGQRVGEPASQRVGTARRECGTQGCRALTLDGLPYCFRCEEELSALNEMARLKDARAVRRRAASWLKHEERCARFRGAGQFVRRWLWLPELAICGGAVLYVACVYAWLFLRWVGWV